MRIEQKSIIEDWIVANIRNLWLMGTTFKEAARLATKKLEFVVSPARTSRLRGEIAMRLPVPFDAWNGRCRRSKWPVGTLFSVREWLAIEHWIMNNKKRVCKLRDVTVIARMAVVAGVKVNPAAMLSALEFLKFHTGYDPGLTSADGVASEAADEVNAASQEDVTGRAGLCSAAV